MKPLKFWKAFQKQNGAKICFDTFMTPLISVWIFEVHIKNLEALQVLHVLRAKNLKNLGAWSICIYAQDRREARENWNQCLCKNSLL